MSGFLEGNIADVKDVLNAHYMDVFQTGYDKGYLAAIHAVLDSIDGCYLPDRNPEYMDAWEIGYTNGVDCVNNRVKAIKEKLSQ